MVPVPFGDAIGGNSTASAGSNINSVGGPRVQALRRVRPVAMVLGSNEEESVVEVVNASAYLPVVVETRLAMPSLLEALVLLEGGRAFSRWGA